MSQEFIDQVGLPEIPFPTKFETRGKEHEVQYQGGIVLKFAKRSGPLTPEWVGGRIKVRPATAIEYFKRLAIQNFLFEDDCRIVGYSRGMRPVVSQPLLVGGEPTEGSIDNMMRSVGFERISHSKQDLASGDL